MKSAKDLKSLQRYQVYKDLFNGRMFGSELESHKKDLYLAVENDDKIREKVAKKGIKFLTKLKFELEKILNDGNSAAEVLKQYHLNQQQEVSKDGSRPS